MRIYYSLLFIICASAITLCHSKVIKQRRPLVDKENSGDHINNASNMDLTTRAKPGKVGSKDLECQTLVSKRYIQDSDNCTTMVPVIDLECAGSCYPVAKSGENNVPGWSEFLEKWTKTKQKKWRCAPGGFRRKAVEFYCKHDGTTRTYQIRTVKNCKCKRVKRNKNKSPGDPNSKRPHRRRRQRRRNRRGRGNRSNKKLNYLSNNSPEL